MNLPEALAAISTYIGSGYSAVADGQFLGGLWSTLMETRALFDYDQGGNSSR